jgi:hypothetical protein
MSRIIRFDHFLPVERSKFLSALEAGALDAAKFEVSKMEISPPLMPGVITALVTVKLASRALAFSYEDAVASSWVEAFQQDLRDGCFGPVKAASPAGAAESDAAASGPAALSTPS